MWEKSTTIMEKLDSAGPETGLRSGSAGRFRHQVMPGSLAGRGAVLTADLGLSGLLPRPRMRLLPASPLFHMGTMPVTRYRFRATRFPAPRSP
jgi:hypothetical protein